MAFVIDTFARRTVGWRVSRTAHAHFVLDALGQALHDRRPRFVEGLFNLEAAKADSNGCRNTWMKEVAMTSPLFLPPSAAE